MSNSPFAAYANAVLRFQVASGDLVADSNGNLRPGRAVVEATAMLSQKRDPNREPRPGVDSTAVWLEGYLVEPRPLPSIVTPDAPAEATWQGRQGKFLLEFTARNPYLQALNIDLVEQIRGYFMPGSFVVQGEPWEPTQPPEQPTDDRSMTRIAFSWGDATPKTVLTVPGGKTVFTATIVIVQPFNGVGASLRLGDAANPDRLMAADQNLPGEAAEFETNPGQAYLNDTPILLTIQAGEGASAGSGFVLLDF